MKALRRRRIIDPHVEVSIHFAPGRYTSDEEQWYPLIRRLDGPQSRSGLFFEKVHTP